MELNVMRVKEVLVRQQLNGSQTFFKQISLLRRRFHTNWTGHQVVEEGGGKEKDRFSYSR